MPSDMRTGKVLPAPDASCVAADLQDEVQQIGVDGTPIKMDAPSSSTATAPYDADMTGLEQKNTLRIIG